jgi:hypothetical protein
MTDTNPSVRARECDYCKMPLDDVDQFHTIEYCYVFRHRAKTSGQDLNELARQVNIGMEFIAATHPRTAERIRESVEEFIRRVDAEVATLDARGVRAIRGEGRGVQGIFDPLPPYAYAIRKVLASMFPLADKEGE